jgi:predicted enzyme related to lactoylglutathione lyase
VGELRTRTERLHAFGSLSEVEEVLTALAARSPEPLVERMPRQPGQKEARTRHLLGGEFDVSAAAGSAPADPQGVPLPSEGAEPPASTPSRAEVEAVHVLQSRVLLRPASFDASVAFYEQTLGLTRYREWGGEPARGVVYFLGGGYLELSESPAPVAPSGVRLWLQVADVAAAARQLTSAGARVLAPPRREPWGLIEMTVADPDGLELVVVEVPDDHPLRRDTRS